MQHAIDARTQRLRDRRREIGRAEDRNPRGVLDVREARFGERRNIGKHCHARMACHGQWHEFPFLNKRQCRRCGYRSYIDVTAKRRVRCLTAAAIWNVHSFYARNVLRTYAAVRCSVVPVPAEEKVSSPLPCACT